MKTLLLLDPGDRSVETKNFYLTVFNTISNYTRVKYFYSDLEYLGDYYIDCYNNEVDEQYQRQFAEELSNYQDYDLVITNSPNQIVREVFDYVLNLTIGIYSRPPFKLQLQLDPWGIFGKSLTFNAPKYVEPNHDIAFQFRNENQHHMVDQYKGISLFPFNSHYWPSKVFLYKSYFEYYKEFEQKYSNTCYTKKPSFNVDGLGHTFDYDYFDLLPEDKCIDIDSSLIVPNCDNIWVSHSTLGFQAALWGVNIDSPSLFKDWTGDQVGTAGGLLDLVWFTDKHSFHDRVEKLKDYKHD